MLDGPQVLRLPAIVSYCVFVVEGEVGFRGLVWRLDEVQRAKEILIVWVFEQRV